MAFRRPIPCFISIVMSSLACRTAAWSNRISHYDSTLPRQITPSRTRREIVWAVVAAVDGIRCWTTNNPKMARAADRIPECETDCVYQCAKIATKGFGSDHDRIHDAINACAEKCGAEGQPLKCSDPPPKSQVREPKLLRARRIENLYPTWLDSLGEDGNERKQIIMAPIPEPPKVFQPSDNPTNPISEYYEFWLKGL